MYKKQGDKAMSSTKLIVLKSKELIYTAILVALIAVFVIIMICMFGHRADKKKKSEAVQTSAKADTAVTAAPEYTPGTYSAAMTLGESTISVVVTVDSSYITDVSFVNLDESVKTMYPLLEASLEDINTQLHYVSSVDDITPSDGSSYTTLLLVNAIRTALEDAVIN